MTRVKNAGVAFPCLDCDGTFVTPADWGYLALPTHCGPCWEAQCWWLDSHPDLNF
jgi:hypothetical protein